MDVPRHVRFSKGNSVARRGGRAAARPYCESAIWYKIRRPADSCRALLSVMLCLFVVVLIEEVVVGEAGEVYLAGHGVELVFELVDVCAFTGADKYAVVVHLGHPRGFQFVKRYVAAFARSEVVIVFRCACEGVDFVEYEQHGLVGAVAYLAEGAVNDFNLLLEVGV